MCRGLGDIWITILTRDLPVTHPIACLLQYVLTCTDSSDPGVWNAILTMDENKISLYEHPTRLHHSIAGARHRFAGVLFNFKQRELASKILNHYVVSADACIASNVGNNRMRNIYYRLGGCSYDQRKFDKSIRLFRRAREMNDQTHIPFALHSGSNLVMSLLRVGQTAEGLKVLQQILEFLEKDSRTRRPVRVAEWLSICYRVKALCDDLAGFEELQGMVKRFRDLRLDEEKWTGPTATALIEIGDIGQSGISA